MPPLVFLPGAGGSASFWRPVADRLADLGQVHVFGFPGFGGLPADPGIKSLDDLFGWLVERLPPGTSHVIAQSMGGVLAARLALERPERVARLVLVATSGGVDVARLGAAEWRHDYRALQPDVPTWFIDDQTDLTDRLAEIRARTLLLWSDADPISPPSPCWAPPGRAHRDRRGWDSLLRQRARRGSCLDHQVPSGIETARCSGQTVIPPRGGSRPRPWRAGPGR